LPAGRRGLCQEVWNQARFDEARTLALIGERAEESSAREDYAVFQKHPADLCDGRISRLVDHWRSSRGWHSRSSSSPAAWPVQPKRRGSELLGPDQVLTGRVKVTAAELLDLIHWRRRGSRLSRSGPRPRRTRSSAVRTVALDAFNYEGARVQLVRAMAASGGAPGPAEALLTFLVETEAGDALVALAAAALGAGDPDRAAAHLAGARRRAPFQASIADLVDRIARARSAARGPAEAEIPGPPAAAGRDADARRRRRRCWHAGPKSPGGRSGWRKSAGAQGRPHDDHPVDLRVRDLGSRGGAGVQREPILPGATWDTARLDDVSGRASAWPESEV
jgi:hypothetical protein